MTILALRPEPGLSATLAAGRALGLEIAGWPLFELRPLAWDMPAEHAIDGVLLGSANALRHGGAALDALRAMPAFAVGAATAEAARAAGFAIAAEGSGGLQQLLDTLAGQKLTLLRLAGAQHVPLAVPPGIRIETRVVYEAAPLAMVPDMVRALAGGGPVLLHSAEAARHFAAECDRLGIDRGGVQLAALGPRIAAAAGGGWRRVRSAEIPREAALLAMARDMCH